MTDDKKLSALLTEWKHESDQRRTAFSNVQKARRRLDMVRTRLDMVSTRRERMKSKILEHLKKSYIEPTNAVHLEKYISIAGEVFWFKYRNADRIFEISLIEVEEMQQ